MTKRDYSYQIDDFCDLAITGLILFWLYMYISFSSTDDPEVTNFTENLAERYMYITINKNIEKEFQLMPFLAVIVFLMWGRFLLMLQLTRTFGPMLRIIIVMFGDVLKFLFIWSVMLLCLSSVAGLLFGELDQYADFIDVIFIMFGTGLGNYDLGAFDTLQIGPVVGEVYIILVVLINSIVLLNFIIAILADTYGKLSSQSLGLYYDGIIARIPVYEDDSRYGGLIIGTPPFNVLAVLLVPIFCCVKDERKQRVINDKFVKLLFLPVALLLTVTFMAFNLVMLPFAYLTAIYQKYTLMMAKRQKEAIKHRAGKKLGKHRSCSSVALDLLMFIVLGVPILVAA